MSHFYDGQAWSPKDITFVHKAAFDGLGKATQDAILKAAAAAEDAGWTLWEEQSGWYLDQLTSSSMKVEPPSGELKAGLKKVGDQLTADCAKKAGADSEAVIAAYKK